MLGMAIKQGTTGIEPGVWENWLAAAPVVAVGAPLGTFVVGFIGRRITLLFVAALCVVQFVWACYHERAALGVTGTVAACLAVMVCVCARSAAGLGAGPTDTSAAVLTATISGSHP